MTTRDWTGRFFDRIDTSGDCWEWTSTKARGYGVITVEQTQMLAHRVSYLLHFGDLPAGSFICHHCDNRGCCNPAHLYAGDVQSNSDDAVNRGRLAPARGEAQGSAVLNAEQIRAIRAGRAAGATTAGLARAYGCSPANVHKIITHQTWKHVG